MLHYIGHIIVASHSLLVPATETVCASVSPLMTFHVAKLSSKVHCPQRFQAARCIFFIFTTAKFTPLPQASEAAAERARESKMRCLAYNIFACASRCAGVALSKDLRVSLQTGLVYALLR